MVAIIDYDAGNIKSVEKAVCALGGEAVTTRDKEELLRADHVILPGVGSFGEAMDKIRGYGLETTIREIVARSIPFLGICLGLQLLFESSEECGEIPGLGILQGKILKIPAEKGLKIPHVGWNSLHFPRQGRLFRGIEEQAYVYFVHSYYLKAVNQDIVAAVTEYGVTIDAAIEQKNLFACQFHPEKSSETGLDILNNFLSC